MPMIEFSHVTACGLDITVQGHFLKCAPSTHPTSFPPYPNKSCFSGKSAQPLMFLHKAKTMLASRLWSSACLFKNYRALQLFPDSVQCLICSKECTQLTSHYMQETSKRWSFIALAVHQKGSIHHYPLALIWLLIKVACPRWVPTVWTNYLLSMFQCSGFIWKPSPPIKAVSVKGSFAHEAKQIQDTILEVKDSILWESYQRHNTDLFKETNEAITEKK